jgi:NitT/TauT family transport system substrate-binding protein
MMFRGDMFDVLASCPPVHPAKTRQQLARCTRRLQFTVFSGVSQRVLGNHVNCHRIIGSSAVLRPAVRLLGAPFRLKGENMKRFAALAVSLVLLCSASLFAQDVVRLGNLKFAHYGAVSYMKELGPKYNLRIEERIFPKGIDIIPAIIAGEIDIAASAADGAVAGRSAGAPVYAVAGFSKGGIRILGRKDLNLKSVSDLKGKKVGVARGGAQELALLAELAKYNLTWSDQPGKDVLLIYMAYADLNQAMLQKQLDAMCQSEPQSAQAIAKGFATEIVKPYDTPLGEPVRVMVMTEKMYKEKPDVALRVLKCFVEATKTFLEKPDLAEKYVRDNLFKGQISDQEYKDAMSNAQFTYDLTVEHIQTTTDLMVKYKVGRLQNPPKATDWVKLDVLQKAKAALGAK